MNKKQKQTGKFEKRTSQKHSELKQQKFQNIWKTINSQIFEKNKPKFAENHTVGSTACSEDCDKAYQLDERNCGQAVAAV